MPTPALTEAVMLEAWQAFEEHGNVTKAARELGLHRNTYQNRLEKARKAGLHLSQGAQETMQAAMLNGAEIKGGYKYVLDENGNKLETVRWSAPEITPEEWIDKIESAFSGIKARKPLKAPKGDLSSDQLAFLPHADWHLGMVAEENTEGRDYNRNIAVQRITDGMAEALDSIPSCEKAIILNAGDLTHAHDNTNRTEKSRHVLKVEGSHDDNLFMAIETTITLIEMAAKKHGQITYKAIAGNHDSTVPGPLSFALQQRYRDDPRITIEYNKSQFWDFSFGKNFVVTHHGHGRKPNKVIEDIPAMYPEKWGAARHWYYVTGHLHDYISQPIGSVRHIQLPSVCSLDRYSSDMGFHGDSGIIAATFQKAGGIKNLSQIRL